MTFHRLLRGMNKNQRGFTLVELLVVIAVSGLIAAAVATSIYQVFNINSRTSSHMIALTEVENAVHWLTRDAQMAQNYADNTSTSSFPLTMTWTNSFDSPNTSGSVTYSVANNELQRVYTPNTGSPSTVVIAQHIDSASAKTNWSFSEHAFVFRITATVSSYTPASETRLFNVLTRSVP